MKISLFNIFKIIVIIVLLLIVIKISIEEFRYRNQISEPPKSNSILVMSYSEARNTFIDYFKEIVYSYLNF